MALTFYYTGGISDPTADRAQIIQSRGGDAIYNTHALIESGYETLFDHISADEASSGESEYRALDLVAEGGNYTDIELYIASQTSSPDTVLTIAWERKNDGVGNSLIAKTAAEETEPTYSGMSIPDSKWFNYDNGVNEDDINEGDQVSWNGGSGICYYHDKTNDIMAVTLETGDWPLDEDYILQNMGTTTTTTSAVSSQPEVQVNGTPAYWSRAFANWTYGTRLELSDLDDGQAHRIWFKRVVDASASAMATDQCQIQVEYLEEGTTTTTTT